MDFIESTGVTAMPTPSSHFSDTKTTHRSHTEIATVPTVDPYNKLNKLIFQLLLGLILVAFSVLFIMILVKLPGAF